MRASRDKVMKLNNAKESSVQIKRFFLWTTAFLFLLPSLALGQIGGGFSGGGGGQGFGGGGGGGFGGISIDAQGVVSTFSRRESSQLTRRRIREFLKENFEEELAAPTAMRKVSLREIERLALQAHQKGEPVPLEIQYLYGLLRIDFIIIDPDRADVILAGPAEGFVTDAAGRIRGATSGRPPVNLDDLLVAFRSTSRRNQTIGVSIDPTPQNTAALAKLVQSTTVASRSSAVRRFQKMGQVLGMQKVSLFGVPKDSHFAQVLVEADYRMKRIAIGKEKSGVRKITSQLTLLKPNSNTMQRWWFTALYNPIEADEENLTFRISGPRCQLMAQEEWADASGNRSDSPFTQATTQKFAKQFTDHFEELAQASPVFSELQNCFDLAVVAALLRKQNIQEEIGWNMESLLDETAIPIKSYPVPQTVPSVAMSRTAGRFTLGMIGGVTLNPYSVIGKKFNHSDLTNLKAARDAAIRHRIETNPGWWN